MITINHGDTLYQIIPKHNNTNKRGTSDLVSLLILDRDLKGKLVGLLNRDVRAKPYILRFTSKTLLSIVKFLGEALNLI